MADISILATTDKNGDFRATHAYDPPGPADLNIVLHARLATPEDTQVDGALDIAADGAPSNQSKGFRIRTGQAISLGTWWLDSGDNQVVVSGKTTPPKPTAALELELNVESGTDLLAGEHVAASSDRADDEPAESAAMKESGATEEKELIKQVFPPLGQPMFTSEFRRHRHQKAYAIPIPEGFGYYHYRIVEDHKSAGVFPYGLDVSYDQRFVRVVVWAQGGGTFGRRVDYQVRLEVTFRKL